MLMMRILTVYCGSGHLANQRICHGWHLLRSCRGKCSPERRPEESAPIAPAGRRAPTRRKQLPQIPTSFATHLTSRHLTLPHFTHKAITDVLYYGMYLHTLPDRYFRLFPPAKTRPMSVDVRALPPVRLLPSRPHLILVLGAPILYTVLANVGRCWQVSRNDVPRSLLKCLRPCKRIQTANRKLACGWSGRVHTVQ